MEATKGLDLPTSTTLKWKALCVLFFPVLTQMVSDFRLSDMEQAFGIWHRGEDPVTATPHIGQPKLESQLQFSIPASCSQAH